MRFFNNICLNCGCDDLEAKDELCEVCQAARNEQELLILCRKMQHKATIKSLTPIERTAHHGFGFCYS